MTTVEQHIELAHGGNISAFARAVNATRPTIYRWVKSGCLWHNERVWDPVTPYVSHKPATISPSITGPIALAIEALKDNADLFDWLDSITPPDVDLDARADTLRELIKELSK